MGIDCARMRKDRSIDCQHKVISQRIPAFIENFASEAFPIDADEPLQQLLYGCIRAKLHLFLRLLSSLSDGAEILNLNRWDHFRVNPWGFAWFRIYFCPPPLMPKVKMAWIPFAGAKGFYHDDLALLA